uniref:Uncharacterized protein n=1 Tax=Arundo donax TaxID=35708 RepID=A0A0A9BV37_ARUDO
MPTKGSGYNKVEDRSHEELRNSNPKSCLDLWLSLLWHVLLCGFKPCTNAHFIFHQKT